MLSKNSYVTRLKEIIRRYLKGTSSKAEKEFLDVYYQYLDKNDGFISGISEQEQNQMEEDGFQAIKLRIENNKPLKKQFNYHYAAAAAILVVMLGGGIYYFSSPKETEITNQLVTKNGELDVLPGANKATLTLADGSKIYLDNKKHEGLLKESGIIVSVNNNGELVYLIDNKNASKQNVFHTLETSKGNQFQIVLSDGTKVWLNAKSTLRFPETFGDRRTVELTGEGYFEVAKDKVHPFIVKTQNDKLNQEVEVLGTKFNINSYLDEPVIKTTLIEGNVKVEGQNTSKILEPNFQSRVNNKKIIIGRADVEDEIAWKNGNFSFSNASLKSILEQLERWYDIEVDKSTIPTKRYNGFISRNVNLSEVLNMLSLTGNIKFSLSKDRKLTIIEN